MALHVCLSLAALLFAMTTNGVDVLAQAVPTHDSAGVRFTVNSARLSAAPTFQLSGIATTDFGGLQDNPDHELSSGPFVRLLRLASGGFVIADDVRLILLNSSGQWMHAIGRIGQGPGEFRQINTICLTRGDTLVASDMTNGRVTILTSAGSIVREIPTPSEIVPWDACFSDGTWVALDRLPAANNQPLRVRIVRRKTSGQVVQSSPEVVVGLQSNFTSIALDHVVAVCGTLMYVGDSRTSAVRVFDVSGQLLAVIGSRDTARALTRNELATMRPSMSARGSDPAMAARIQNFNYELRTSSKPPTWPLYAALAVGPRAELWVEDYRHGAESRDFWTEYSPDGRMLGRLSLPAFDRPDDARLISFIVGGALVRRHDSDGAAHLSIYPILPARRP